LEAISQQFTFAVKGGMEELVRGVTRALAKHIDPRALDDIKEELPKDIAALF
jgi:uncharacterized protein (DUF2267 family)